jgi:hypothetical protein
VTHPLKRWRLVASVQSTHETLRWTWKSRTHFCGWNRDFAVAGRPRVSVPHICVIIQFEGIDDWLLLSGYHGCVSRKRGRGWGFCWMNWRASEIFPSFGQLLNSNGRSETLSSWKEELNWQQKSGQLNSTQHQ